jgi:hypothetical protein
MVHQMQLTDRWFGWFGDYASCYGCAGLGVFAYLSGDIRFANYLHIPYVKYTSELVVICSAMIGAGWLSLV